MNKPFLRTVLFSTTLTFGAFANADTRTVELWKCEVREGKTIEDVHSANSAWVDFVNGKVEGGGIQSLVLTSVVGKPLGFMFVDSYPNMAAWIGAKAALKTPEGQAVDASIFAASNCPSNSLHESTES